MVTRLQNHMQKVRVLHTWWWVWFQLITGGYGHLMGKKKPGSYSRQAKFVKDILLQNILNQAAKAIDILEKHSLDEDHVLVYNNATTHQKQVDGALLAHCMPLNTSKLDGNWLVDINAVDRNGKQIYTPDGKFLKTKVQMEDATLADGTKQPLYFPPGHPKEGLFKE